MRTATLWPVLLGLCLIGTIPPPARAVETSAIGTPVIKWQYAGCTAAPYYCDTGWYASPAVADLDGDGKAEVIWGGYKLFAFNGEDGSVQWSAANGQRIWPGIAVADINNNGSLEIVVGRGGDQVTAYSNTGAVLWTRSPFGGGEVRTLAVEDLEHDGQLEVIVGRAGSGATRQVNVFEANGNQRSGWPARRDGENGYGWGMYNENIAIADMNGDGYKEIFAPTDTHYITALDRNGNQLPANAIYGTGKVWSQVGVHVDHAVDLRGYANCGTEHRPNFANAAPAIADLDGDSSLELIVPGDVYNCGVGDGPGDLYYLPWILKLDRTRWSGSGYDWTVLPAAEPGSGPLSQDYNRIENAVMNAVLADLDGDDVKEIIYPSYDGRIHAYWLDKTQHGNWPFDVPGSGIRFASEPAVVDLNNDGHAEVIFTSWPEKSSGQIGQLHILDYQGNQLYAVNLPVPDTGSTWNGGLGAPTIANIDADTDLEAVVGTVNSGAVAYDLPGSSEARVLWGTGRGSFKRTGLAPDVPPALRLRLIGIASNVDAGSAGTFTVEVLGASAPVNLSLGAPSGPAPLPTTNLSATTVTPPAQVTITLTDQHPAGPLDPGATYKVTLTASGSGNTRNLTLTMIVGGTKRHLPMLR